MPTALIAEDEPLLAAALLPRAEFYAEWAVRESRIGKVADKIAKNQIACTLTPSAWDQVALGGVRRNDALRIVEPAQRAQPPHRRLALPE